MNTYKGSYMPSAQLHNFGKVLMLNGIDQGLLNDSNRIKNELNINIAAIFELEFHLPSYPDQQICQNYHAICADYLNITRLKNIIPENCDKTSNGISLFPSKRQTVLTISLSNLNQTVIFETSPNMMGNSTNGNYRPVCPAGYVDPDTPDSDRNTYVKGKT
jgi:hypothetical protein